MSPHGPTVRPTRPGVLALAGGGATVVSAAAFVFWQDRGGSLPIPGWMSWVGVALLAAGIGWLARVTRRTLAADRSALDPAAAVTRIVLGKTSRLAGVLLLGVYAALIVVAARAWPAPLAIERVIHAGLSVLACGAWMLAGRSLERACRIPEDDDSSDGDDPASSPDGPVG
ncbi:MAG: DUF3180 domain-containing protein [Propioniciclava sp.]|uniref:DUF3180 domain-containing protein n=1 Tax=Propioniciclava sp. TaxID=2038686 RepID=UPI0039E30773